MTDLRLTFDEDPEVYDRVRPAYPAQLFEDLRAWIGRDKAEICEVGAGTGKATASLLELGPVTAVEIGSANTAFLRRKFAEQKLTVVQGAFEEARLEGPFDAVVTATAWHWLEPGVRLERSARLLRGDGVIAVIDTNQIASAVDHGYFAASQAVYARYGDEGEPEMPGEGVVPAVVSEIGRSPLFGEPVLHRYRWDQTYSRGDYQDLMRSYSNMRAMGAERMESLIGELGDLIDRDFGGAVTRPLVITLVVARKISAGS